MTEPERRLWWHLRHRLPVQGSHFRRQVALGAYVADFSCLSARLIVEVDGDHHGFDLRAGYDARRTKALAAQGFRILRFTNADVMRDIDAVLVTILAALDDPDACGPAPHIPSCSGEAASPGPRIPGGTTPTSNSSPQGGGELAET